MTSSIERQVDAIITELRGPERTCTTCYGVGPSLVWVPEGADPDAPEYHPTACPDCGTPAREVMQIIGMSEDEVFPDVPEGESR